MPLAQNRAEARASGLFCVNKKGFCNGPLFVNPSSTCDILSPGLASVRGRRMAAT
jgi:hypothetical protein